MAKQRSKGEGTFYFDEIKQLYRAMITTPAGNRLTKSSKNEEIVSDWLNEQRLLVGRRQHIEPHNITLGDWIDEWLETYAKPSVRPRTYDRYKSLLAHTSTLQKTRLTSLIPAHFQKLYNSLSTLSGTTRKHIHYCLSGCLEQAVINRLLYSNPIKAVEAPKATTKEIETFTAEELDAIRKAAESDVHGLVIFIATNTGMRLSEILALTWKDIDLKKNTISIKNTVHYSISAGTRIEDPKNQYSKRTISIDKALALKIKEHKLKYASQTYLFMSQAGNNVTPHNFLRWHYDKIRTKAGVTKGFHALRHTHATELIAAGVPLPDVSRRLGHSRISTTMDIYAHVIPKNDEKMINTIDIIFNKKPAPAESTDTAETQRDAPN
ncbi:MAG TPA: tyrosine-type recombinase/integrase [Selenomonadales bacterium]|nr:tyrosine-type recombinase/integrase [Selenomonadales bacterium]